MSAQHILTGQSSAPDARQAVHEFHAAVRQPDMELVLFFCSSEYDLDILAEEMNRLFGGIQVVGCTTAGEIGPEGYLSHSLSGASFSGESFVAAGGRLDRLREFNFSRGNDFAEALLQRFTARAPRANGDNSFALLMIDGMSVREEPVAYSLQNALGSISLFGGSAGDDQKFVRTHVFCGGAFHTDSAVLVLVESAFAFKVFKTQHFISTDERLVVTEANPAERTVKEINGINAAEEYARLVGVPASELDATRFAAYPVVVMVDGTDYVRSIQKTNPDGSLTFFCAIDEGVIFRVGHGVDLIANLERTFEEISAEIGPPQLVIGCDCILRNLETAHTGQKDRAGALFRDNRAIGFSSYGEQFRGVHVNQTLTGIAIGHVRHPKAATRDD